MGKKKAFIDKKNAQTFSLVFRSTEGDDDGPLERVLVPQAPDADCGASVASGASGFPPRGIGGGGAPGGDPRALFRHFFGGEDGNDEGAPLTEARRRELLEYGFPDDGYDYLSHCRVIGRGSARMESGPAAAATAGPSAAPVAEEQQQQQVAPAVFIPATRLAAPAEDVKLVDARRLRGGPAPSEPAPGGVATARTFAGGRLAAEIAELEEVMAAVEADDGEGPGSSPGEDDFFDGFVARAAAAGEEEEEEADAAAAHAASEGGEEEVSDEYEEFSSGADDDGDDDEGQERVAPSAAFAALNDQFENLLDAYDEDELGDLDMDPRAAGSRQIGNFAALLGGAAAAGGGGVEGGVAGQWGSGAEDDGEEGGLRLSAAPLGGTGKVAALDDRDDAAIAAVRARVAAQEARAAARAEAAAAAGGEGGEGAAAAAAGEEEAEEAPMPTREQWDCESILMVRSTMSYTPARIASEPARIGGRGAAGVVGAGGGAEAAAAGLIKLNARTGLPSGYAGKGGAIAEEGSSGGEEEDDDEEMEDEEEEVRDAGAARPKGESAEERRARKAAVKEAQREAREAKRQLKDMFKKEAGRQRAQGANARRGTTIAIP
jgi:protein LTV1